MPARGARAREWPAVSPEVALAAGIACAAAGGELFVRGAVGIGRWLRIPAGVIGVTIAAFATSSPEVSVGVNAGLAGVPEIALGDALGSSVVNVALILGLTLLLGGLRADRRAIRRDFGCALGVPVLIGILGFDGSITRIDAGILFAVFAGWLLLVLREALASRTPIETARASWLPAVAFSAAGLGTLVAAGSFIVEGARGVALSFGLSEFVIGATVVAVATSMPELATTLVARFRGHHELGLGNILGSNIFNGLVIVGCAALLAPIPVTPDKVAVGIGFGLLTVLLTWPGPSGLLGRRRGSLLLATYAVYVAVILQGGGH